jgi:hypothetical protein
MNKRNLTPPAFSVLYGGASIKSCTNGTEKQVSATFKTAQRNAPQVIIDINNKDYSASADGIEKEENERCLSIMTQQALDHETKN